MGTFVFILRVTAVLGLIWRAWRWLQMDFVYLACMRCRRRLTITRGLVMLIPYLIFGSLAIAAGRWTIVALVVHALGLILGVIEYWSSRRATT